MHIWQHLCEESRDSPARFWVYRDEDFGGTLSHIATRRGGANTAHAISSMVLDMFLCKQSGPSRGSLIASERKKRARLRSKFCFGRVARSFVFMHACIQYIHVSVVMHAYMSTYTHTHACMHYIYYCDVYFLLPVLPILLLYSIIILQCSKQIHWVGSIDLYVSCNDLQARRTTSDSRISYMELACMHAMMLPMPRDRSSTQSISISTCDHLPAILADIDPCK